MTEEEPIYVATSNVSCDGDDGGDGHAGHPRVYLNMGAKNEIVCPYCSRHYALAEGTQPTADH